MTNKNLNGKTNSLQAFAGAVFLAFNLFACSFETDKKNASESEAELTSREGFKCADRNAFCESGIINDLQPVGGSRRTSSASPDCFMKKVECESEAESLRPYDTSDPYFKEKNRAYSQLKQQCSRIRCENFDFKTSGL